MRIDEVNFGSLERACVLFAIDVIVHVISYPKPASNVGRTSVRSSSPIRLIRKSGHNWRDPVLDGGMKVGSNLVQAVLNK